MAPPDKSVLFVCLGNICRSVMAESLLKHMVAERGQGAAWTIDSAATSDYEIGSTPDSRTNEALRRHDIEESEHIARQITKKDFERFHYIFGFDLSNMSRLERMKPPGSSVVVEMFGKYGAKGKDDEIVQDPYYSNGTAAFDKVYDQCWRACEHFLDKVVSS